MSGSLPPPAAGPVEEEEVEEEEVGEGEERDVRDQEVWIELYFGEHMPNEAVQLLYAAYNNVWHMNRADIAAFYANRAAADPPLLLHTPLAGWGCPPDARSPARKIRLGFISVLTLQEFVAQVSLHFRALCARENAAIQLPPHAVAFHWRLIDATNSWAPVMLVDTKDH